MKKHALSLKSKLFIVSMLAAAAALAPAAALAVNPDDISTKDKLDYLTRTNADAMNTMIGIAILFGVIFFVFLFDRIRLWRIPRMGYFMVTAVILSVRYREPDIIFWKVAAFTAGMFSLMMFFISHRHVDFDSRKEPLYFLFNAFTLLIISFSINFYLSIIAATSLIASLFFVTTRKPVPHGKFIEHDADAMIMDTLEKKAKRPL